MKAFIGHGMLELRDRFRRLYGDEGLRCIDRFQMLIGRYGVGDRIPEPCEPWSEKDAVLITYGDMVRRPDERPLLTLQRFLSGRIEDAFNTVHILPFFPYSSDDGFSVTDYRAVRRELGTWEDIETIAMDFRVMADLVINHCSSESGWFQDYVTGVSPARFYFLEVDPETDLSGVTRPRSTPLLTRVQTREGERFVWSTFSEDQIDVNFANPDVLFEFLDILFYYISRGVKVIRLDAIAYLWKKIGTRCIHLPETHEIVKLFRTVVNMIAPDVLLITETNVPHGENVSYFGDGDEAHVVYQFTLPPLLLHGLLKGTAKHLTEWADGLSDLPAGRTFLNFTASHDGIGVRPLEDVLSREDVDFLVEAAQARGGQVSTKRNPDGSDSPYELNITCFDALGSPDAQPDKRQVARFLCSQMAPLALRGIPAVYFNSLVAGRNWHEGVRETGRARTINRQKWDADALESMLRDRESPAGAVFRCITQTLAIRREQPAFHPDAPQKVLRLGDEVFAVERAALDGGQAVAAISNFCDRRVAVTLDERIPCLAGAKEIADLLGRRSFGKDGRTLTLMPYATAWLTPA